MKINVMSENNTAVPCKHDVIDLEIGAGKFQLRPSEKHPTDYNIWMKHPEDGEFYKLPLNIQADAVDKTIEKHGKDGMWRLEWSIKSMLALQPSFNKLVEMQKEQGFVPTQDQIASTLKEGYQEAFGNQE